MVRFPQQDYLVYPDLDYFQSLIIPRPQTNVSIILVSLPPLIVMPASHERTLGENNTWR
jgi:hypothetical protein